MEFSRWLELKYIEWQSNQGGRKTVMQFGNYLGFPQQTLSSWMNGTRTPQGDNVRIIAEKLGIEVYDVLNLPRPDPMLFYIQKHWDQLDPDEQQTIREQAEEFVEKNEKRRSKTAKRTKPLTS